MCNFQRTVRHVFPRGFQIENRGFETRLAAQGHFLGSETCQTRFQLLLCTRFSVPETANVCLQVCPLYLSNVTLGGAKRQEIKWKDTQTSWCGIGHQ